MAGLQVAGVGSGLDINGLVTQLMQAERAPLQAQMTRQQTANATEISALAQFKGALAGFQSALQPLKELSNFSVRSAKSSDEKIFTAAATNVAAPGRYEIEVESLATAHQISADAVGSATSVIGTGALTINVAGQGFTIEIDSTNSTLGGIRDAINRSSDNKHVRASIVTAQDGAHLVLTATDTGAANTITVASSGGDGGLATLNYGPGDTSRYDQLKEALDSEIRIATYTHRSPSRTITGAIDGVTLTLLDETEEGDVVTLDIANDVAAATTRVKAFVDQYNALQTQLTSLQSYEPSTKKAGPLLGDALARTVQSEVRRNLGGMIEGLSGEHTSLADIGIKTNKDGMLELDNAKLKTALERNFDGVAAIFASEKGVAKRMLSAIDPRLAADGELATRRKGLDKRSEQLQKRAAEIETRMAAIEARYRKQFTALDQVLSGMQSTSSYLQQQLANLPGSGR